MSTEPATPTFKIRVNRCEILPAQTPAKNPKPLKPLALHALAPQEDLNEAEASPRMINRRVTRRKSVGSAFGTLLDGLPEES